jgi:hypothetical protein
MKKLTEKKLKSIDKLIKEEMAKQYLRHPQDEEIIEIIDEGIMSQLAAKAKGMGTKIAAKGGNLGTAFKLAAAAAKGDQKAIANLSSQLKDVNLEGEIKQAESLIQNFQQNMTSAYKGFMEDLVRAGFTALPGVANAVDTMTKEAEWFENQMPDVFLNQLRNETKKIQQVAQKTGAAEAGSTGEAEATADAFSIPKNVEPGSKEELSILQKRIGDIETKTKQKSTEEEPEKNGAMKSMAGNAKDATKAIFGAE